MSFKSELFGPIDDNAYVKPIDPNTGASVSGYKPRNYGAVPQGSIVGTSPFPRELLIPREQWKERIEEKQRKGIRGVDLIRKMNGKWLNQSPSNYCWFFATCHAVMILRGYMGLPFVRLNPFIDGCIIDGGANRGGWGTEGLEHFINTGCASDAFSSVGWGQSGQDSSNNQAIRSYRQYVEASRDDAAKHKVTEWWDLTPRSLDEKVSCLLQDPPIPVSSGYNYEGHQTVSVDAIWTPETGYGVTDMDSYTRDGSPHLRNRSERRAAGDDQVAPRVTMAS